MDLVRHSRSQVLAVVILCLGCAALPSRAFHVANRVPEPAKIVGGNYASITDVPYQAALLNEGYLICGATIITEFWLVSAAHCFLGTSRRFSVRTGSSLRLSGGQLHDIEKVVINKNYVVKTNDNDIALIKLKAPIRFNKYQKAIAISKEAPRVGDVMRVSGYGREGQRRDEGSPLLKVAYVRVVSQRICELKYIADPITSNAFCAGRGDHDACQGDSGGPGIIDGKLAGIVSSGAECGSHYYPGIYTRVDKYVDWIQRIIGGNGSATTPTPGKQKRKRQQSS